MALWYRRGRIKKADLIIGFCWCVITVILTVALIVCFFIGNDKSIIIAVLPFLWLIRVAIAVEIIIISHIKFSFFLFTTG